MSKRKRKYSPEETRKYERRYKRQPFKQPDDNTKYEWVDMTFYIGRLVPIDPTKWVKMVPIDPRKITLGGKNVKNRTTCKRAWLLH